jgi:polar amino acid transport system substrate-binding protein
VIATRKKIMRATQAFIIGLIIFLFLPFQVLANEKISICTDSNYWYPFTFVKDKQAAGLHVDIINKALNNLGYSAKFTPLPWKQCLQEAKAGKFDAVATISYKDDRALFLNFPEGAANDIKSPFRITQVEYVIITPKANKKGESNNYVYNGQISTIPQPTRIPEGYSIIDSLERAGLKVEEGKDSHANFKKLIEEQTGSMIDLADIAKYYNNDPEFTGKFIVQDHPLVSKSYYLAFAKEGKIKSKDAEMIWAEIKNIRQDSKNMAEFVKKY